MPFNWTLIKDWNAKIYVRNILPQTIPLAHPRRCRKDRAKYFLWEFISLAHHSYLSSGMRSPQRQVTTLVWKAQPLQSPSARILRAWPWFSFATGARACDTSHHSSSHTFSLYCFFQKALKKLFRYSDTHFLFSFQIFSVDQEKRSHSPSWSLFTYDFPWHFLYVDSLIQIGPIVSDMNVTNGAYTLCWQQYVLKLNSWHPFPWLKQSIQPQQTK